MAALNPTLISLSLKLANSESDKGRKLARKIARFTHDTFQNPQITCAELS